MRDHLGHGLITSNGPNDESELEVFTDWVFAEGMKRWHVPGAVILLVKDGEIFFKKGYGSSDLQDKTPVDPDKTLFKVGSITKLFTTTAIMQLAERGLLSLDDDVNVHLDLFQVPNPYRNPVTVATLLTHTAGFDHQQIGRYSHSISEMEPLGRYLKNHMPRPTSNPGEFVDYSGFGLSLAGFLVEEITKIPYSRYVKEKILSPLEMNRSGFLHEMASESERAVGYRYAQGHYVAVPNDYLNLVPSGALVSTAADMAKFMIANLQDGRYQNRQILKPETIREMHQTHFRVHPKMPGWCYGFYETYHGSNRAIMHSGHPRGFSNLLYLLKDKGLGIFIAYNSNNANLYREYIELFHKRYFPTTKESVPLRPPENFASRAHRFTGTYLFSSSPKYTLSKLRDLLEHKSEVTISADEDGILNVHLPEGTLRIVETEPLLFRTLRANKMIAFQANEKGEITHMFMNGDKPSTLEKLSWWETFHLQINLLRGFLLIFLSSLFIFILYYFYSAKPIKKLTLFASVICFLNLAFLVGILLFFNSSELRYGISAGMTALLCVPVVTSLLSAGLPILTAFAWQKKQGTYIQRLHFSLITLIFLAFIPLLHHWNLLAFNFWLNIFS